ncbi:MAG: hypothetical protein M1608_11920 [Candidatus Omnitrophica bacterium]|nr:hypothetical protein [Candidatus Omnitrophota bacterium]
MNPAKPVTPGEPSRQSLKPIPPDGPCRTLILIPIIHTQADMGALSQTIRQMTIQTLGKTGWERKVNTIEELWRRIEKAIGARALNYPQVRLYQDGLPVCGRESEIVNDLANAGSRNHQLLLRLMSKGATLMGTESAELLVQEYQFVKQLLDSKEKSASAPPKDQQIQVSRSLLKQRDQAIASRINATLEPGETGLLFLGMLHSVNSFIEPKIALIQLDY